MEELLRPIIERWGPTMQALQDAKLSLNDIDKIILIGGPTRMPMVRQFVATVMGKEPERGVDPMEAVAMVQLSREQLLQVTCPPIYC